MKKEYLKNREEVVQRLSEMMLELDQERNLFEIEIYLYVDEEGKGTLEYFANPGGNSWRADDHYVIYTCEQFFGSILDEYELEDIAQTLSMTVEELKARTAEYHGFDVEDVDVYDIHDYIENEEELMRKMDEDYNFNLSTEGNYREMAEDAVEEYERECWEAEREKAFADKYGWA